jgi:hypothetical protein
LRIMYPLTLLAKSPNSVGYELSSLTDIAERTTMSTTEAPEPAAMPVDVIERHIDGVAAHTLPAATYDASRAISESEGKSSRELFVLKPHAISTFTEKLNAAIDEHINEIADHLLDPVALRNLKGLGKPSRELFVTGANLILQQNGFPAATGDPARRVFV